MMGAWGEEGESGGGEQYWKVNLGRPLQQKRENDKGYINHVPLMMKIWKNENDMINKYLCQLKETGEGFGV